MAYNLKPLRVRRGDPGLGPTFALARLGTTLALVRVRRCGLRDSSELLVMQLLLDSSGWSVSRTFAFFPGVFFAGVRSTGSSSAVSSAIGA